MSSDYQTSCFHMREHHVDRSMMKRELNVRQTTREDFVDRSMVKAAAMKQKYQIARLFADTRRLQLQLTANGKIGNVVFE